MNNVSSFKKLYLTAARQAQDYLFYMFRIIGFSSLYSKILFANEIDLLDRTWTQDHSTDYGHPIMKSNKYENFGRCGRRNMLRSYLKIWEWEQIFGSALKAISSPGVRSPQSVDHSKRVVLGQEQCQKCETKNDRLLFLFSSPFTSQLSSSL